MNVLVLVGSVHVDIGHFVQEWCNTCPQAGPKTVGFSASDHSQLPPQAFRLYI